MDEQDTQATGQVPGNTDPSVTAEDRQASSDERHAITRVGDTGAGDFDAAQVVDTRAAAAADADGPTSETEAETADTDDASGVDREGE